MPKPKKAKGNKTEYEQFQERMARAFEKMGDGAERFAAAIERMEKKLDTLTGIIITQIESQMPKKEEEKDGQTKT